MRLRLEGTLPSFRLRLPSLHSYHQLEVFANDLSRVRISQSGSHGPADVRVLDFSQQLRRAAIDMGLVQRNPPSLIKKSEWQRICALPGPFLMGFPRNNRAL